MIDFKEGLKSVKDNDFLILLENITGDEYVSSKSLQFNSGTNRFLKLIGIPTKVSTSTKTTLMGDISDQGYLDVDKLEIGETIHYRVNSEFLTTYDNNKAAHHLQRKPLQKFIKDFGSTTQLDYGNKQGEHTVYVYKITMTNIDGYTINLNWSQVEGRCKELGLETFPVIWKGSRFDGGLIHANIELNTEQKEKGFEPAKYFTQFVKSRCLGKSKLGSHISTGIVVRNEMSINIDTFYEKSYLMKCLK